MSKANLEEELKIGNMSIAIAAPQQMSKASSQSSFSSLPGNPSQFAYSSESDPTKTLVQSPTSPSSDYPNNFRSRGSSTVSLQAAAQSISPTKQKATTPTSPLAQSSSRPPRLPQQQQQQSSSSFQSTTSNASLPIPASSTVSTPAGAGTTTGANSSKSSPKKTKDKKWKKNMEFVDSTNSDWFDDADEIKQRSTTTSHGQNIDKPSGKSVNNFAEYLKSSAASSITDLKAKISSATSPTRSKTHTYGSESPRNHKESEDWIIVQDDKSEDHQVVQEILDINSKIARIDKFYNLLHQENIDLEQLKKLSWNGIPEEFRPDSWRLLMGYMPSNNDRREQTLSKKRKDYQDYVTQSFGKGQSGLDQGIWHQITIDIPRTNPSIKLYQQTRVQKALERILYCWSIRHPASGYVQGINDIATPFFQVFISEYIDSKTNVETMDLSQISDEVLNQVEADTFWCLSKLLDGIQDNYTHAQPGIIRQITKMKELIGRIDATLLTHLKEQNIEFIQFAFRWMNCLLMREMPMRNVIRMWDTYLAEGPDGFSDFHVYVCGAFLVKWSKHLMKLDFQDIIIFLQSLPTKNWAEKDIELLLSEAYMWKSLFHYSPSHLIGAQQKQQTPTNWSI